MPSVDFAHRFKRRRMRSSAMALATTAVLAYGGPAFAAGAPKLEAASASVDLHDFRFGDGETMPLLKLHYLTLGSPVRDSSGAITNAVLLLHGTTGTAHTMVQDNFGEALYAPGRPLDITKFFLVIPDGIGAGGSSKPSDGLRARFPHYGYNDQVRAQHGLLAAIGIKHVKMVLGTSMGGMQSWLWAETYPNDVDSTVAIASTPAVISGRNMMWREMIMQAIRTDPDWDGGNYPKDKPPQAWSRTAFPLFAIMTGNADQLQKKGPTRAEAIKLVDTLDGKTADADDFLYSVASSADYDPAPRLGAITKPMLTINFADDLLNPTDLLHLPKAANFTEAMLPGGYGHQTLTHAEAWGPTVQSFVTGLSGW